MAQVQARAIEDDGERMIPEFHHDAVVYAEHMISGEAMRTLVESWILPGAGIRFCRDRPVAELPLREANRQLQ